MSDGTADDDCKAIIVSCAEELEATPVKVRMFRAGMGWGPKRLARECAAVAAETWGGDGSWFDANTIVRFEAGFGIEPRARAVLEETLSRHCWVSVVRGEAGVCLKAPEPEPEL
jgi:hypothetical protein